MEQRDIFSLIDRFDQSQLTKLVIKEGDFTLQLENQPAAVPVPTMMSAAPALQERNIADRQSDVKAADSHLISVKAPLVGVFYTAPAPDAPVYATLGDKVEKGQVLCLIEAMKMMNELKSPVDGIIRAIKADNGGLVEFDQVLFEVEPC